MERPAKEKVKLELRTMAEESETTAKPFAKSYTRINCPACTEVTTAENLEITAQLAKCQHCNAVFSIEEELARLRPKEKTAAPKAKPVLARPAGIERMELTNELELSITQPLSTSFSLYGIIFMPFILLTMFVLYFKGDISVMWPITGTALTAYFLLNLVGHKRKKVHFTVDEDFLTMEYRPKGMMSNKRIPIPDIDQLYCQDIGDGKTYNLRIITNGPEGQKHRTLLHYISGRAKAHYMEQEIERYLGILDRNVPEANPRTLSVKIGQ